MDLSQPSTFRFPCDANCPEDCRNTSQYEHFSNGEWEKDPNLEVACTPGKQNRAIQAKVEVTYPFCI